MNSRLQPAIDFVSALRKLGFVPSPQVEQMLQQQGQQGQPPQPPPDPTSAAGAPLPADPSAGGAPGGAPPAGAPPPGADPSQGAQGAPPPPATLDDVMAGMEQLAQMISQIPQQMASAAPQGEAAKKKSPAERMDAIEQQLAQLTGSGGVAPGAGAPAPAGGVPAAGGPPSPAPASPAPAQ
jgi:hypothetical protein